MNLEDGPLVGRGHFDHGLIGFDLGQGLVFFDLIAFPDQPADDLSFCDSLADIRKLELLGHV